MRRSLLSLALALISTLAAARAGRAVLPQSLGGEWLSTSRPFASLEDVTARTGVAVTGDVAYWATPTSSRTVEHVAARTPAGDLIVFWWAADGAVHAVNVSAKTGVRIAGPPLAWLGAPPREHIAAVNQSGTVTLFTWTPESDWTAAPVSLRPLGKTYTGHLVQWVTPGTRPVQHIAATATDGEVMVAWRNSDFVPFSSLSITAKTGVRASGLGGAWITGSGVLTEHLVAAGTDGRLHELVWSPARDWTALPIPLPAGHGATADLASWLLFPELASVALRTSRDALVVVSRLGAGAWGASNLTEHDGQEVAGRPSPFRTAHPLSFGYVDALAARGKDGEALVFWQSRRSPLWQILSLSDLTAMTLAGSPTGWIGDGVAGIGADGRLRVARGFTEGLHLTERLLQPFEALRAQLGLRRTVTILWNPETNAANCAAATGPGCLPCNSAELGNGVRLKFEKTRAVDAMQQLADYYRENSGGLLAVENVATLGWYSSQKPGAHYWQEHGAGKCADGWGSGGGGVEKWVEAIRLAANEFDFRPYDTNGDKVLSRDELAVVIMIPNPAGVLGFNRGVLAENGAPLVVQGIRIPDIVELYVFSREKAGSEYTDGVPHLGTLAHEMSHRFFDHADQYWITAWGSPFPNPTTALGGPSLMDNGGAQGHQDAFSKLKFGWVRPRILWHPGRYTLNDVETRRSLRVLLHPTRGTGEFFVFENRFRGSTFDRNLPADGLAIYHVMQDRAVYQSSRPPFYLSGTDWAKVGAGDWPHRAVRALRPVSISGHVSDGGSAEGYSDFWSLWRPDSPRTSYDLEPFPATRERAWIRWGDGSNPGIAIRSISAAGPAVSFTVAMAPPVNPALCASRGKNCGWIDDGLGGQVNCGTCTGTSVCGGGGVPNVCGCTPRTCDGRCGTIDRGCGLGTTNCGPCDEGFFCNPQKFCQIIPEPCECGGKPPACLPCRQDPLMPPAP